MTPRPRTPLLHPKAGAPRGAPSGNCPSAGQERSWSSEGALEQTGAAGWGGTHGGLGSKYRERAPSPAAPRVPSHPSAPAGGVPGLAGRGAQGRGGEGDLRGSAAPGSRLGPPPPAPAPSFAHSGAGRAAGGAGPTKLKRAPPGTLPAGARCPEPRARRGRTGEGARRRRQPERSPGRRR